MTNADVKTMEILKTISERYNSDKLKNVLNDENSILFKKDIYISLKNIIEAIGKEGDVFENLKQAKNLYNAPIFAVNLQKEKYILINKPDLEKGINDLEKYKNCFKLSPYSIINTYLAIIEAQVSGFNLDDLVEKGIKHIEDYINNAVEKYSGWDKDKLVSDNPVVVVPIGAAGCGKSTFYKELPNVLNISCDNVRYLLFKEFGPCFSSWESCISWWVVNQLTDIYINKGYSIFYNGVNTDMEYRSPLTMEIKDPLYDGIPYNIKLVYFNPPVELNEEELNELKSVNLWAKPIDEINIDELSDNVAKIMNLIKTNYGRTLKRTEDIKSGKIEQDPFDVLYSVPAGVVKLFVEQSFDKPAGDNVIEVPRKEIPDAEERSRFYRGYADKVRI